LVLGPGAQLPPIEELEDFWDFYHKRSVGRMRGLGNGHATLKTLLSNAKKFKAGFIRRTGTQISEEFASAINQVSTSFFHYTARGWSSN
jgi:hypothetical protein